MTAAEVKDLIREARVACRSCGGSGMGRTDDYACAECLGDGELRATADDLFPEVKALDEKAERIGYLLANVEGRHDRETTRRRLIALARKVREDALAWVDGAPDAGRSAELASFIVGECDEMLGEALNGR